MKDFRHRLAELPQLTTPNKNKIHESFHIYEKLVKNARQDIQRHLNVLRQKEADQTGGARAKVTLETEKKREETPKRKEHDNFSDDLSKKDKKRNWKEEQRLEAEMYREFEVKKLLADQKKEFEERLRKGLLERKRIGAGSFKKSVKRCNISNTKPFSKRYSSIFVNT